MCIIYSIAKFVDTIGEQTGPKLRMVIDRTRNLNKLG